MANKPENEEIKKRIAKFNEEYKTISESFSDIEKLIADASVSDERKEFINKIKKYIADSGCSDMKSFIFEKAPAILEKWIIPEFREDYLWCLENMTSWNVKHDGIDVCVSDTELQEYAVKLINITQCFHKWSIFRYPSAVVVTIGQMNKEDCDLWYYGRFGFFTYSVAARLAAGDEQTEKFVYDILDGTSRFLRMHRAVAISCFLSGIEKHFEKCYEFFGKAGVEEDARKMIAEASAYGKPASESWFLRKITDDKLFRFVSVKSMFLSAYGIGISAKKLKDKDYTNMAVAIADALEGKDTQKYFSSSDKWTVYAAFAGTAGHSYKEFMSVLKKFIFEGKDFQKESAHFFIKNCGVSFQAALGRCVFENCSDFRTLALFSDCFLADIPVYAMISNETGQFLYENGYYDYLIYADDMCEEPKDKTEQVYSPSLRNSSEAEYLLGVIKKLYESIGKEKYTFPSETEKYTLNKGNLAEFICILSFETKNRDIILKASELIPEVASRKAMTSMSGRDICLCLLFLAEESEELIQRVFPFLADKDRRTRLAAEFILGQTVPSSETAAVLEDKLSVKSDEIRDIVVEALKRLDENERYECAQRLAADKNEERKKAGKSLMKTISGKKISVQAQKIQLFDSEKIKYPEFVLRKDDITDFCSIFTGSVLNSSNTKICSSDDERRILQELDRIFEENKNYEYQLDDGTAVLLGNRFGRINKEWGLESFPLSEVWKKFYEEKIGSYSKLLRIMLCLKTERCTYFSSKGWALYGNELEKTENLNYKSQIDTIFYLFRSQYHDYETDKLIYRIIGYYTINILTDEERTDKSKKSEPGYPTYGRICFDADLFNFTGNRSWGVYGKPDELSNDEFREYYSLSVCLARLFGNEYYSNRGYAYWLTRDVIDENIRAYKLGIINRDTLLSIIYKHGTSRLSISYRDIILSENKENQKYEDIIRDIYNTLAVPMIDAELARDDDSTEYTDKVFNMSAVYGTERFVKILEYFGSEKIHRGRMIWSGSINKNLSFSHMLRVCIPGENEDVKTLEKFLKGKKISDQRLVEAALYSSDKWIKIIGEYLGWEGFEMCCLFFVSHAGNYINDEQKSLVERCTRLKAYDIQSGVCDPEWLKKVYAETGEKHFKIIYEAAKYISESNTHTRARKYSDAVLGKYDADKIRAEIEHRRNKELLSAYALIPLRDRNDAIDRYLYFLRFYKEAKKFGNQRCDSEQRAALTAIHNLAVNSGYTDVHRFRLRMDNFFMEENSKYFEWTETEGISLRITIKEKGKASVEAMKDGKILKSVPASLKKNSLSAQLRTICSEITQQYRRTRNMFENAMENGISFDVSELLEFLKNPAASPVVRRLVFKTDDKTGFLTEDGLKSYDGKIYPLDKDEKIIPAHCSDLYKAGIWGEYQKYLYDTQTVQPFRQVFRELYTKTAEESELRYTSRYDGYKVEGRKAAGCFSSRGWSCYHESIMEKVFYDSRIMAEIRCSSYWYSNYSSAEPDIKKISFYDFKKNEYMKICDVPDIVFSEVMRDADLAVSVAHTAQTDPETSLSTVEMRRAVAEFTLKLFKRDNVRFEKNHAFIKGKISEYSVHLGSGIVHISGGPQLLINTVKPSVKGKIFLPYEDENDRTAEIITKIILLTEDNKIKDQYIYSQIISAAEKLKAEKI